MKYYELTYIALPDLSEEELNNLCQKVNGFISKESGLLDVAEKPIKKTLGYPVKKQGEAFLISVYFRVAPENIKNIEKKIKETNQILRYIILTKKEPQKMERMAEKRIRKPKYKTEGGKEKIELKELDKKIEEILQEA